MCFSNSNSTVHHLLITALADATHPVPRYQGNLPGKQSVPFLPTLLAMVVMAHDFVQRVLLHPLLDVAAVVILQLDLGGLAGGPVELLLVPGLVGLGVQHEANWDGALGVSGWQKARWRVGSVWW